MKKLQFFKNALISLLTALLYMDICLSGCEMDLGIAAGMVGMFLLMMHGMYALDYYANEHARKGRRHV